MRSNYLPTDYQTFIATSRYARWLEDENRRETWPETVQRYINYISTTGLPAKDLEEIEEAKELFLNRILEIFKHLGATKVDRYELPNLNALNFVIHNALGGGVNSSLRLDRHGKTLSSHLLHELILPISEDMLPQNSPYINKFKG